MQKKVPKYQVELDMSNCLIFQLRLCSDFKYFGWNRKQILDHVYYHILIVFDNSKTMLLQCTLNMDAVVTKFSSVRSHWSKTITWRNGVTTNQAAISQRNRKARSRQTPSETACFGKIFTFHQCLMHIYTTCNQDVYNFLSSMSSYSNWRHNILMY
jgi:hypothetical protein